MCAREEPIERLGSHLDQPVIAPDASADSGHWEDILKLRRSTLGHQVDTNECLH
ncbi:hypothetical protein BLL52_0908 [Rhodoferax antarcticus ANT.BR]|uniref:Uncharacterized protein n=1 Tax=Rhodoferax antarcticus ANT.BR TaxID=1111071 RepID=A0A1Q8YIH7_9BURK|nr:hypothetical protein BLL52_0908 [Rhodoferax antarcticus ANT.BR]